MFDKLLENIQRVDRIENKLLSIFEGKSWEYIATALYQILDDIDTVDDVCRENAEAFRNVVMKLQAKKNQYLYSPDGYSVTRVDEDTKLYTRPHSGGERFRINHPDDIQRYKELAGESGDFNSETRIMVARWNPVLKQFDKPHPLTKETVKTWEVNECVCHIYGLSDEKLLEFYGSMGDGWNAFNEPYGSDKTEVEAEIEKRGLDVKKEPGDKYSGSQFGPFRLTREEAEEDLSKLKKDGDIRLTSKPDGTLLHYYYIGESKLKEGLVDHAQRELQLAGMFDEEVDGSEAMGSWNKLCAEAVLELMEVFAEQGHSGFSASMTQDLFSRLSKFEALTELTDNPDEWNDISEMQSGEPGWQSQRNPSCFSGDGGKTYWDVNEDYYLREDEEDGMVYSGGLSEEEWKNRPIHQSKHFEKKE